MDNMDRLPVYNLSAVLRETGLKAELIRAWERRYNLPRPQRSAGGHRLYSQYDIETLKWLKSRQAEGFSISRAADLWHSSVANGRDPLSGKFSQLTPNSVNIEKPDNNLDVLRARWLEACMQFNSTLSEEVLNQAFSLFPVETVCTSILQKGLNEIGSGWFADKVSVQQEHFASALASRRVETLMSMTPQPSRNSSVLLGCPQGEWHTFPMLLIDLFLRRRGWRVVNLGADIPVDRIVTTTISINPDLVVMAAQTIVSAASLRETYLALRSSAKPLGFGGLIFNRVPELRNHISGVFLGEDLESGISVIENLLQNPDLTSVHSMDGNDYQDLIRLFQEKRTTLELDIIDRSIKLGLPFDFLNEANTYFGNGLIAAMKLGDPKFIWSDLEWIRQLIVARQMPISRLIPYLRAYQTAVHAHLGSPGNMISDLLDSYIIEKQNT